MMLNLLELKIFLMVKINIYRFFCGKCFVRQYRYKERVKFYNNFHSLR